MNDEPTVGYADFVKLCRVSGDPQTVYSDWAPGLEVREDGVYVVVPSDVLLFPEEAAVLSHHPSGNLAEPALRFPCSLAELQDSLEDQGVYGCIDPFDMADWLFSKSATSSESDVPSPNDNDSPKSIAIKESVVEPRIRAILKAIETNDWNPLDIRWGGKAAIRDVLLKESESDMNDETFRTAWKAASRRGLLRMHEREKYCTR